MPAKLEDLPREFREELAMLLGRGLDWQMLIELAERLGISSLDLNLTAGKATLINDIMNKASKSGRLPQLITQLLNDPQFHALHANVLRLVEGQREAFAPPLTRGRSHTISPTVEKAHTPAEGFHSNRVLQVDVFGLRDGDAIKNPQPFVIGLPHRVEVFIGPEGSGALQADEVFPDRKLDWQASDEFTLGVIFSEPNQWEAPQSGELVLKQYGASTRCRFDFTPTKIGPFRARLTVHYRGRVLQTALLEATVVATRDAAASSDAVPRLFAEAQIHGNLTTLDDRRRFDVSLVLNRTVDDQPTMQAAGREGAFIRSLTEIEQQLAKISTHLRDVANDAKRYSKGLESKDCTAMLIKLATEGRELYGHLVLDGFDLSPAARELAKSEYLQIVTTKPDAVVPLELVYEYAFPADDAKPCPKSRDALVNGRCAEDCDVRSSPAPHVCPMGFWGLSKVIERHAHNQELGADAFAEAVEPIGARSVIPLKGAALLAASNNVAPPARKKLEKAVIEQWKVSGAVKSVGKWVEWKRAVGDVKPTLLIALPHSSGSGTDISLEISGDTFKTRFIDKDYLRPVKDNPPPLVLLMGCDVAGAGDARSYTSHVRYFRQGGAPVILGTLAIIEGGNAATVSGLIVEQLVKVVSRKPDRFGEVLREAKREAMKSGLLMVLGLVGFGDADWALEL